MTKAELIKALARIPDDAQVWLEVDGYWGQAKSIAVAQGTMVVEASPNQSLPKKYKRLGK